jgi:BirA family transcriptional regulator, biotin operon repressor / biotin---[acetyl-CoA-carboxylase] ligase
MLQYPQSFTIGNPFIQLNQVSSTNSYAIEQIQANLAAPGTAYFALQQTAGRGQRQKTWETEAGSNIITSIVVPCNGLLLHQQFMLSVVTALACQQFFNLYANGNTTIKWPNDIYWNDRKAAGILIENIVQGQYWNWAVIGIGININQTAFSTAANKAISLTQITGQQYNVIHLTQQLYALVQKYINQLLSNDTQNLLTEYNNHLFLRHQTTKLKQGNRVFEATIQGVNAYGQLVTHTTTEELFNFGDIEWLL